MMDWTDAQIATLTSLWTAGKSGGYIGTVLGCTASTVIGKVHRLKLPSRPSPIKYAVRPAHRKPVPKAARPVTPVGLPKAPPAPRPAQRAHAGDGGCRWTDSSRAPWQFCGEACVGNTPWCAVHHNRVYPPKGATK